MTPQEYFDRIKDLHNPDEIKTVCETLTDDLFNETDKPKTRVNKLTPYNKLITAIPDDNLTEGENAYIQTRSDGSYWKRHLHFKFTGIADTNFNGKDGINTKTVVLDRLENQQEIPVNDYLETTVKLLQSSDPHELAIGLIAASGRRPIEILARGSFTLEEKLPAYLKPGYFVQFRGQAKKREYDVAEDERTEYRIGLLVPAVSFLQAFERFQAMPETKEILEFVKTETAKGTYAEQINASIDDRRGNSLRRVVQRNFTSLPKRQKDTELNPKALRAVYVNLITERDCPKNINRLLWASRAIGHFVDSAKVSDRDLMHLVTTLGYSDYYIDSEVPYTPEITFTPIETKEIMTTKTIEKTEETNTRKERKSVSVDSEAFARIKELQTEWGLENQQSVISKLLEMLDKQPEPKAQKPERNLQDIDTESLKKLRGEDAVNEKIRRAFEAITTYNDSATEKRWCVNNQGLRQISGCNGQAVSVWMKEHQTSIDDHNKKYNLGQYDNKGRGDITEVIKW
ncbi:telomere resolvase [Plectonema radiosum NIES-515]|uniref:Telomere resolvase n=1 Tax=Plectonema radiosum NIES-515 TaxID=2986073 RepID=A0ABT3AZG0_9CYAN|nr:telomere resolvase [Plectonema radiosum]MCV3214505.1 telomere resolvase [Plectonema radiosum NIES-515]